MTAQKGDALLDCGCVRTFNPLPAVGDIITCIRHPFTTTTVITLIDREWAANCSEYRCPFGRHGTEEEVIGGAERHTAKYPHHEVRVFHQGELVRVVTLDSQETFDGVGRAVVDALMPDEPAF